MGSREQEPKTYTDRFKSVDSFKTAYWSGIDVSMYCGDVWIDDALQFGIQAVEQVNPYYGYAEYSPSRMHHGVRIFTGEFTVNYKHSNYIFAVLEEITRNKDSNTGGHLNLPINYNSAIGAGTVVNNPSPEDTVKSYMDFAKNYSKMREAQNSGAQKALNSLTIPQMTPFGPMFKGPKKGFEITVLFGAQLNTSLILDFDSDGYSPANPPTKNQTPGPATGFRLIGVSLTGSNLMINDSGQPVMETYNFMARGVVPLSGASIFGYTDSKTK